MPRYQDRYIGGGMVPLPQPDDPMRTLAGIMQFMGQADENRARKAEDQYRTSERERVATDRSVLQSAHSSRLPPDQVEAQLAQLGRGDLVPVFKQTWGELETSRLGLKKAQDEAKEREADVFGAYAAGIKKSGNDPLAVEWSLQELEREGRDVTSLRARLKQQPDALGPLLDEFIARSPTQRKLAGEEEARRLSGEREERMVRTQETTAANILADNERARQAAEATAADRLRNDERARQAAEATDADRRRNDERANRPPPVNRAQAEQWRATQKNAVDEAARPRENRDGEMVPGLSTQDKATAYARIDAAFYAAIGEPAPTDPAPQRSVGAPGHLRKPSTRVAPAGPASAPAGGNVSPARAPQAAPPQAPRSAGRSITVNGQPVEVTSTPVVGKIIPLKNGGYLLVTTVEANGDFDGDELTVQP
jgi:hypothetical protein